ncbi:DUF4231 domain-containing protein [Desulfosporosinus sp. OT]|uniref:DUF4231 domain-containing protein n=1 Tax=Desulfosporosinus sp. OT TaxID=913865 RepID=UPI000223A8A2|nr:DUF4231 domain-containing protein [Desulfosporosinus sp. OT]EGW40480.1 hypothetical protein DOT_1552 [Desulfosporosinus sp. OT]
MINTKGNVIDCVDNYIKYYDRRSIKYKRLYYTFFVLEGVISALIPVVTLFFDFCSMIKYIVALMGTIVALITMFKSSFGFHRKWIDYRSTTESLKLEKDRYTCELSPYKGDDREQLFFDKAINTIDQENKNWRIKELDQFKNTYKTDNHK